MLDAIPDAESTVLKEPTQTISEQFAEAGDWANQKFTTGPGEYIEEPEFTYLTEGFKTAQDIMADLDDAPLEDPVGDRKSTRLNSSHVRPARMPSSA